MNYFLLDILGVGALFGPHFAIKFSVVHAGLLVAEGRIYFLFRAMVFAQFIGLYTVRMDGMGPLNVIGFIPVYKQILSYHLLLLVGNVFLRDREFLLFRVGTRK